MFLVSSFTNESIATFFLPSCSHRESQAHCTFIADWSCSKFMFLPSSSTISFLLQNKVHLVFIVWTGSWTSFNWVTDLLSWLKFDVPEVQRCLFLGSIVKNYLHFENYFVVFLLIKVLFLVTDAIVNYRKDLKWCSKVGSSHICIDPSTIPTISSDLNFSTRVELITFFFV